MKLHQEIRGRTKNKAAHLEHGRITLSFDVAHKTVGRTHVLQENALQKF
jgi:hypothetical protein